VTPPSRPGTARLGSPVVVFTRGEAPHRYCRAASLQLPLAAQGAHFVPAYYNSPSTASSEAVFRLLRRLLRVKTVRFLGRSVLS